MHRARERILGGPHRAVRSERHDAQTIRSEQLIGRGSAAASRAGASSLLTRRFKREPIRQPPLQRGGLDVRTMVWLLVMVGARSSALSRTDAPGIDS